MHDHPSHEHHGHGAKGPVARASGHHHHHDHAHAHGPASRVFAWGIGLNLVLVVVQITYGWVADSLALIADASHNLSDVLGLAIAWVATVAARMRPTARLSYGLRATSIWAAMFNAMLILLACGGIAWEAYHRIAAPRPVDATIVIWVGLLGTVINAISAWFFHRHAAHDLNARGAFLHLLADAGVSLAVVLAAIGMLFTGWQWLDPACSLAVVLFIFIATWRLLRQSIHLALGGVPAQIDPEVVRTFLGTRQGVTEVHDLHVWAIGTNEIALTAHLIMPEGPRGDQFLQQVGQELGERFHIHHATIQIERGELACPLASDHVV